MVTIWKYPLEITDSQVIRFPTLSWKVRHVGLDPTGKPCLWVEVDTEDPSPERYATVLIIGTGHPVPENAVIYLGTFIQAAFVWHVYLDTYHSR